MGIGKSDSLIMVICVSRVYLSRRDWLRWASTWEGEIRQLVELQHRMKISENRLKK